MDDGDDIDMSVFDTSKTVVEYHRSKDLKRVTVTLKDPGGISEMRLYLLLSLELEKLERRLGITEHSQDSH